MKPAPGLTWILFSRFTLRHWRSTPRQSLLLVAILALGIAVYLSIRLANRAAVASFQNFTELITEESDWIVSAPAGLLPESALTLMRSALGNLPVELIPVLESTAARPRTEAAEEIGGRETFHLLGIDLIAVQNAMVRRHFDHSWFASTMAGTNGASAGAGAIWPLFQDPLAVFVAQALADREHLRPGDELLLVVNEQIARLHIAGIIPSSEASPSPPANLLVMDLPALQALTRRIGRIDRVEVRLADGPERNSRREEVRRILDAANGNRWLMGTPSDRREAGAMMTRAFRLNLTILSLIALMVGVYLVFQALDGAVVRRREEIGIMRSLGVEERAIRHAWWIEAGTLGVAGGITGIVAGWGGAQVAVRLVGRTVNALYYATSAQSAGLSVREVAVALGLAVVTALIAGWLPARNAARTPPAQILTRHPAPASGSSWWMHPACGLALAAAGVLLVLLPPLRLHAGLRVPLAGYFAGLFWVLGGGIATGGILGWLVHGLEFAGRLSAPLRLAIAALRRPSGRHRLATAGLLCAVAMTAGMAILVASFDRTLRGWIGRTFQADLFISSDGAQSASTQNRIAPETWRAVVSHPAVDDWNALQVASVTLAGKRTVLVGEELGFVERRSSLAWRDRPNPDVFDPAKNAGLVLVSEAFTERYQVSVGALLAVPTPSGEKQLRVAGVFSDYGNERGLMVIDRRHFAEWFGDELASSIILFLKRGASDVAIRTEIQEKHPGLRVLTNAHLRGEILRIFRQTFAITYALELIGVVVAMAGLGLTLASVLLERRGVLTTLRALGMSKQEMARAAAVEGALLAGTGVAGGLLVSIALGWLLIHVINRQTFGWTLQYSLPGFELTTLAALVIATGAVVSYAVGLWGADLPADREE